MSPTTPEARRRARGPAVLAVFAAVVATAFAGAPAHARAAAPAAAAPAPAAPVARPTAPGRAAIASAHPLATRAGLDVLAQGGNAFDAAVAVSAVLAVVEPGSTGIGGGGFYLLHFADTGRQVMVDGREKAPGAATRDMYLDADGKVRERASRDGPLAAGIPGEPAAWAWLASRYGRLPLSTSLAPAIRVAREGFPLYARLQNAIRFKQKDLARQPEVARTFLRMGEVPEVGAPIRQPELARTLETIARGGFYEGRYAQRLVDGVRRDGGLWTLEDLAGYRIVEREPVRFRYRDATIVSAAPPSSGGLLLANAFNILSGFDLARVDETTRRHLVIEALRFAFRDRAEYLGDPDFVKIPTARLTSPEYAAGQRTAIRLDRATPSASLKPVYVEGADGPSTSHFSVIDRDGNRVGATTSVNLFFGATYQVPGTGFFLNNTMDDFSVRAGTPNAFELVGADANAVAANKRPLSSMTPTFVETDRGLMIIGSPGGSTIISNVLLGILNWLDGRNAQEVVAAPRIHHQYLPDSVMVEPKALTPEAKAALEKLGHAVRVGSREWGNTQVVTWDYASNSVTAASDPRGFGAGLVY